MSFRKNLMCAGAGLLLTACGGGGGGDGLGGSSYDNEIVVRVVFEDGAAFRSVAAVNGDYSELRVIFDANDNDEIDDGDVAFYYINEYDGSTYDRYVELQQYDAGNFDPILNSGIRATFNGDTFEWVLDRDVLENLFGDDLLEVTEATWVSVEANKDGASVVGATDYIPDTDDFIELDLSGRYEDDEGDMMPENGTPAVDLLSVRVLFY